MKSFLLLASLFIFGFSYSQQLKKYATYTNHFNDKYFFEDKNISFNTNGVILQHQKYNSLKSGVFGIYCYERFIETSDSTFYFHFINQYQYLGDSANFDYFDNGNAIAYPIDYDHADLKAPWYSGLTSGVVSSYLFRYYLSSTDEEALNLGIKSAKYMLIPIEKNGVLSLDDEALPWIEEYPNSKLYPKVTNGFISSIIALHEYLQFEGNDAAELLLKQSIKSLKKSFLTHELKNNTSYSLGIKPPVENYYLKLQISQLEHLHELIGDQEIFIQNIIWKTHSYQKTIFFKRPGYLNRYFDFAVPFKVSNNCVKMNLKRHNENLNKPDNYHNELPEYAYYDTIYWVKDSIQQVQIDFDRPINSVIYVFYASEETYNQTQNSIWKTDNCILVKREEFIIIPTKKFLKVRIVVKIEDKILNQFNFKFKNISN